MVVLVVLERAFVGSGGHNLSEQQLLFLEDEEFLQQQLLLDLAIFRWVEVVDIVAKDGFVSWKGWDHDQGADEDQESLLIKKLLIIKFHKIIFIRNSQ